MNNPKIKSIKEAYSMQPVMLSVGDTVAPNVKVHKIEIKRIYIQGDPTVILIKEKPEWYYVGYDKDGNMLFHYRPDSVNVHFETEAI